MTVWRYTAYSNDVPGSAQQGEIAAESAADVRAALRRIGLQVTDVRPLRRRRGRPGATGQGPAPWRRLTAAVRWNIHDAQRRRRAHERAEVFDGLATMLDSGLPLLEALDTLVRSRQARGSAIRSMLVQLREDLRGGRSLAEAMAEAPGWFDAAEIAMVGAGEHGGTLPDVLSSLADRQERSNALAQKLIGALAYPVVVTLVGLGVVVFLSVRTLPELVRILSDAEIATPKLTAIVMTFGRVVAEHWLIIAAVIAAVLLIASVGRALVSERGLELPRWLRRWSPRVLRRMAVARVATQLAELLRTGVPVVEALRVLAPTSAGPTLRRRLVEAADRIERGDELSAALDDEHWFDAEFTQLLTVGQSSGELDRMLERLGRRYSRQANRLIDRLAALLEPAVILILAFMVGTVVMAAVLPLLKLREVLQ